MSEKAIANAKRPSQSAHGSCVNRTDRLYSVCCMEKTVCRIKKSYAWVSIAWENKQFRQKTEKEREKDNKENSKTKSKKQKQKQDQLSLISLISSNLQDLASAQAHPSIYMYRLPSNSSGRSHWACYSAHSQPWSIHTNAICKSSDKSKDNSLSGAPSQYMADATELAVKLQVESECFFTYTE